MTDFEVENKWIELVREYDAIVGKEIAFNIRVRYNPHHPVEQRKEETQQFWKAQVEHFKTLKEQYILHRDLLLKRVGDDARRKEVINTLEGCITDDMERIVLS